MFISIGSVFTSAIAANTYNHLGTPGLTDVSTFKVAS